MPINFLFQRDVCLHTYTRYLSDGFLTQNGAAFRRPASYRNNLGKYMNASPMIVPTNVHPINT